MPQLIENPSRVEAAGTKPKLIDEYVGRVNTTEERLSVARMRSPEGWVEPGQRPDFDEWTLVLDGTLRLEHETGVSRCASVRSVSARRVGAVLDAATAGGAGDRAARPPSRPTAVQATTTAVVSARRTAGERREDARATGVARRRDRHLPPLLPRSSRRARPGCSPSPRSSPSRTCPTPTTCPSGRRPARWTAAVVIKLNGGLGTSMGMTRAKSLLEVKDGLTLPRHHRRARCSSCASATARGCRSC